MSSYSAPDYISPLLKWHKAQGDIGPNRMDETVSLGPILSDSWLRDPKHVLFVLSRYKFVAKMLSGEKKVAEIGAGDGWAGAIVQREVETLDQYDIAPLAKHIRYYDVSYQILPETYDAIYALDVFEHVDDGYTFFVNVSDSLSEHGKLIIGTPSIEGQVYASEPSRRLHINCTSGEYLRRLAEQFFHHVFLFSMNDEVVHTGFNQMSHYNFVVCAEPIQ